MAGSERLEKYGDWGFIDMLAQTYSYSHDDAFKLSWNEVLTIIAYNKEFAFVQATANEIERVAESSANA